MRQLEGITDASHEFGQAPGDGLGDREACPAAVHKVMKSWTELGE